MLGGLAGAQQVRGVPDSALGQQLGLVLEQRLVAHVAVLVALAVTTRLGIGNRRVPDPPPTRDHPVILAPVAMPAPLIPPQLLGRKCLAGDEQRRHHQKGDLGLLLDGTSVSPV